MCERQTLGEVRCQFPSGFHPQVMSENSLSLFCFHCVVYFVFIFTFSAVNSTEMVGCLIYVSWLNAQTPVVCSGCKVPDRNLLVAFRAVLTREYLVWIKISMHKQISSLSPYLIFTPPLPPLKCNAVALPTPTEYFYTSNFTSTWEKCLGQPYANAWIHRQPAIYIRAN